MFMTMNRVWSFEPTEKSTEVLPLFLNAMRKMTTIKAFRFFFLIYDLSLLSWTMMSLPDIIMSSTFFWVFGIVEVSPKCVILVIFLTDFDLDLKLHQSSCFGFSQSKIK